MNPALRTLVEIIARAAYEEMKRSAESPTQEADLPPDHKPA